MSAIADVEIESAGALHADRQVARRELIRELLHSPALLKKVSEQTNPVVTPGILKLKLTVTPEKNSDVIRIDYEGKVSADKIEFKRKVGDFATASAAVQVTLAADGTIAEAGVMKKTTHVEIKNKVRRY